MTYTDLAFLPVQQQLLNCLTTAVVDLTTPPAILGLRYGQEVVLDLSQNDDLCCRGVGWVRMAGATPTVTNPDHCATVWSLELEMGIARCAPMGDDLNIVTETEHTAANAAMVEDFMALRAAVCCFRDLGYSFEQGGWQPAGPNGGCMGSTITLRVQVIPRDGFEVDPEPPPEDVFPFAPYVLGTDVGVPTGTVLTDTVGFNPALPDAVEDITITHQITGAQATITGVKVWRRRRWTATIQPNPGPGETFWFDQCEFDVELDNFCVDLIDGNIRLDIMDPLAIFTYCGFSGNSTTGRCLNAAGAWLEHCDLRQAEDGWGTAYGYAYRCNIIAGTDGQGDPHPDGVQVGGLGKTDLKLCWLSAGSEIIGNSAARFGTDFSPIDLVRLHDCVLTLGGYNLQVRGDPGNRGVTNVEVIRCRFGPWGFGYADFEQVTGVTWTDNVDIDGNSLPSPV